MTDLTAGEKKLVVRAFLNHGFNHATCEKDKHGHKCRAMGGFQAIESIIKKHEERATDEAFFRAKTYTEQRGGYRP